MLSRTHLPAPLAFAAAACLSSVAMPSSAQPTTSVVVTGNPLGRDQAVQPATVLSGNGLVVRRAGTLGETLDGLPGVAATSFGPNSSRPVIRGLDGDRIRLLENGGAAVDASNLSFDHAVAIDPLVLDRIEVLRGPAALLYGGSATGGVVNSIHNRIPRAPVSGLNGRAEVRLGGAAGERAVGAVLEGGSADAAATGGGSGLAWHADVFGRRTDDLRVPRFVPVEGGEALEPADRVRNSASRVHGGALGAGWAGRDGYAGASVDSYSNRYGVTVEPDVFIRMRRERLALGGEARRLPGPFTELGVEASRTNYRHEEVEGSGEVGTVFESRGAELRLQARHAPLGPLAGVVGLQAERLDFSALGEEAFVPATRTRSAAVFLLEELAAGPVVVTAGGRLERVTVRSDGDGPAAAGSRFGAAAERRFDPTSASLGARWPLGGSGFTVSGSLGRTERAPAYYELYADGMHVATGAYERGDPQLPLERSTHGELGLAFRQGASFVQASWFRTRFARFISLDATGAAIPIDGEDGAEPPSSQLPEYAFRAVRARTGGFEIEARSRLVERAWTLDLGGSIDAVRGDNRDSGQPLPRLPPRRLRAGLEAGFGPWLAALSVRAASRQDRVPDTDAPTPGHALVDLHASWTGVLAGTTRVVWFTRLTNAGDKLAFNAVTLQTLRGLTPLGGRALNTGLRVDF